MISEADRYVLAGRYKAYAKKYEEAQAIFNEGLSKYPDTPTLLRHRGHRHITLRNFKDAIQDFSRAAELVKDKPDELEFYNNEAETDIAYLILGQDNKVSNQHQAVTPDSINATKHLYKSTLKSSIYYHWALAHYLLGDFETALPIYRQALDVAIDNDMKVATSDWLYMTLRRAGQHDEAQRLLDNLNQDIHNVVEPSYSLRVKLYQGDLQPEDLLNADPNDKRNLATQGYGVGNWYLYNGHPDQATDVFTRVTSLNSSDAFGFIASEVELKRLAS